MEKDLFSASSAPSDVTRPLAVRMRPSSVEDVLGQSHALKEGSPLRRLANPQSKGSLTSPSSVVLFGPPGVGKTDRKSTRLNSSHIQKSRMPSSA